MLPRVLPTLVVLSPAGALEKKRKKTDTPREGWEEEREREERHAATTQGF